MDSGPGIDPLLVKAWHRRLAMIFFACDLPEVVQQTVSESITFMREKRQCNLMVDKVVDAQAIKPLERIDKRYKQKIDAIATFCEQQANALATTATNVGDFYFHVAKLVEAHRKRQHDLDERTADDLFDLEDDFRIEREDRETDLETKCQLMRESVGYDELQANFEKVLVVLQDIQDSYRRYHSRACFAADKYPLRLADEFQAWMKSVSGNFGMEPCEDHTVLTRYNGLFDEVIRLNKSFFEVDPHAAGVEPRPEDVKRFQEIQEQKAAAAAALAAAAAASANSRPSSKPTSPRMSVSAKSSPRSQAAAAVQAEEKPPVPNFGTYMSPNFPAASEDDGDDDSAFGGELAPGDSAPAPIEACYGTFRLSVEPTEYIDKFFVDGAFAPPEPNEEATNPTPAASTEAAVPVDVPVVSQGEGNAVDSIDVHPDCRWLRRETPHLLWSVDALAAAVDEDDRTEHDEVIAAMFVEITDETALAELSESDRIDYERAKTIASNIQESKQLAADPAFQRTNVPLDSFRQPMVLLLDITVQDVRLLVDSLRDSLVVAAEKETFARLQRAEELTKERKAMFTEELEDRLRTHWPRRGRVETQIKQPREAELLGHQEKTWRHIQSIQEKMKDIQSKFYGQINEGKVDCDRFVSDITGLRNSLITVTYRNLAVLQVGLLSLKHDSFLCDYS